MAETKTKRFEKVYIQGGFSTAIEIWLDKQTGVNYLYVTEGEGGGLTPLLDRDGKPVVTLVESK